MSPAPVALTIDALTPLDAASVAARNTDLAHMAWREYALGGAAVRFERRQTVEALSGPGDVWLSVLHAGSPARLRISRAWADALASSAGLRLRDMGRDKLELLCLTRLMPHWPETVTLEAAAFTQDDLAAPSDALVSHGVWVGVYTASQEDSGHAVEVLAAPAFAVYALIAAFDQHLLRARPPRLAQLPWSLPLVAARWTIDAGELVGLEVGDVLLIA